MFVRVRGETCGAWAAMRAACVRPEGLASLAHRFHDLAHLLCVAAAGSSIADPHNESSCDP